VRDVIAWLERAWPYLVPWLAFLATLTLALRNGYAAERDRRALAQAGLEKEKLELEIARLRNSPEVVSDRRAIYDRLRRLVREITNPADVTIAQIAELHEIRHECEFRYPPEVVAGVAQFIRDAVELHTTNEIMRHGQYREVPSEEWGRLTERHHRALLAVVAFEENLVEMFRAHLRL
jgi:hypothetical protein